MSKTFSIAETAETFGIPASTLRYYDKEGLLPGVERTEGGARRFTPETIEALHVISCLKQSGLSIQQIRDFLTLAQEGASSVPRRLQLLEDRRKAVQKEIQSLEDTLEILNFKCWFYRMAEKLGSEAAVKNIAPEEMPPQLRSVKEKMRKLPADPKPGRDQPDPHWDLQHV